MNILVIDDEPDFVAGLTAALEDKGFDTFGASRPREIRTAVRRKSYEIALLDILIPDYRGKHHVGGLGVLVEILTYRPDAKVILLSGLASGEEIVECLKRGAVDFVSKPIGQHEFDDLVDRVFVRLAGPNLTHDREALRENLIEELWTNIRSGTAQDRGQRLEFLLFHIFKSIPGFYDLKIDVIRGPDQIDIEVVNDRTDPFWQRRGDNIIVECKNLRVSDSAGRPEVDIFLAKMSRMPGICSLGFFASMSGFSNHFLDVCQKTRTGQEVICLDESKLQQLVECDHQNRADLLKRFIQLTRNPGRAD